MKRSLASSFARLSLLAFAALILLTISGWLVRASGSARACLGWPLCAPAGSQGWVSLLHRGAGALAAVSMLIVLRYAWNRLRDDRLLLGLATVTTTLFFAQIYVGAMEVVRSSPVYLSLLHDLTTVSLWMGMVWLVAAASALPAEEPAVFPPIDWRERSRDFLTLTKPVIVLLLLVTTFAGMVAAAKAIPPLWVMLWTLVGGALAAGGSGALNQYIDRDLDKNMQRTAKRPMAAGRMTPAEGLAFGLAVCAASFYILAGFVNLLAALLSLAGIIYYVLLYSVMLKKATVQNIVIGGGAGAIPPLVGWAAVTGRLDAPAFFMFAIIFLWTPPHFWALSLVRRKDYERAGVPMLPVIKGEKETRKQVLIYTAELVALTLLMPILHLAGGIYLASALLLGGWLLYGAWRVYSSEGNKTAWQMYRWSSMYLMFIFLALVLDAVVKL
jgi:protoheme IX farnesyltransferase